LNRPPSAWRACHLYTVDLQTGEWKHRNANHESERVWISNFNFSHNEDEDEIIKRADLVELSGLIDAANEALNTKTFEPVREARLDERFSDLVWFALPSDVDKDSTHATE
jgi:hypothetical protein